MCLFVQFECLARLFNMVTGGEGVPMPVTLHLSWELPDIFSLTHKHTQQNCIFVYLLLFFKVLCALLDLFGTLSVGFILDSFNNEKNYCTKEQHYGPRV